MVTFFGVWLPHIESNLCTWEQIDAFLFVSPQPVYLHQFTFIFRLYGHPNWMTFIKIEVREKKNDSLHYFFFSSSSYSLLFFYFLVSYWMFLLCYDCSLRHSHVSIFTLSSIHRENFGPLFSIRMHILQ